MATQSSSFWLCQALGCSFTARASLLSLTLLISQVISFSQPSYWFSGFQRQGNAQLAQQYEFVAGPGITFGFDGVHSVISAVPGGPVNIQLFGDVTSPLTLLPNVTTTLKLTGTAGTYTKTTFDAQGRETAGASAILASADYLNQGSIHMVLHGNAAGNPSWSAVDLTSDVTGLLPNANLAHSSVTYNGETVALGGSGTLTLASPDFQNQGTTTTLLHGNAAGNPSWAAVANSDLANSSVTYNGKTVALGGSAILGLASADFQNQGTVTTVLHGNAAGNPSFSSVANADLANSSLTYNGKTVALGGSATLTLDSADYQNQGTTTTVLHGNGAGNPSFAQVNLGADVTGLLPTASWQGSTNVWLLTGNTVGSTNTILGTLDNNPLKLFQFSQPMIELRTDKSISIGPSNYTVLESVAIGTNNSAIGTNTVAIGTGNTANNTYAVAIGQLSTASGANSVAIGTTAIASGDQSFACGAQTKAEAQYANAIGRLADAKNTGSMVLTDNGSPLAATTDTAANQLFANFQGGFFFRGSGSGAQIIDSMGKSGIKIVSINQGSVYATNFWATNGYFNVENSNGGTSTAGAFGPAAGFWGSMQLYTPQTLNIAVGGTYYTIVTYDTVYTNVVGGSKSGGLLANVYPGYYRVEISCTVQAPSNAGDDMDIAVMLGGTADQRIGAHTTCIAGASHFVNMSAQGIIYLAAGTTVGIGLTDTSNTGNSTVEHAQVTIGSP